MSALPPEPPTLLETWTKKFQNKWWIAVPAIILGAIVALGEAVKNGKEIRDFLFEKPAASQGPEQASKKTWSLYFDFDKANLKPVSSLQIDSIAQWLSAHPQANVRLQGYANAAEAAETDDDIYGFAIGQRRADAVAAALRAEGVASTRISVVSYGTQQVPDFRTNEEARAIDRVVEAIAN